MIMHTHTRSECLQVESYFFDIRRQLFEYDQVMNTQRDKVTPPNPLSKFDTLPEVGSVTGFLTLSFIWISNI